LENLSTKIEAATIAKSSCVILLGKAQGDDGRFKHNRQEYRPVFGGRRCHESLGLSKHAHGGFGTQLFFVSIDTGDRKQYLFAIEKNLAGSDFTIDTDCEEDTVRYRNLF
jgi:hypothetical protein